MNIEKARYNMIEQQIRPWNVLDEGVLHLLSVVKREDFVPSAYKGLAFADIEIPLAGGQCMLFPKVEARLVQDLTLKATDKVLEVGTGTGFMSAMLSRQAQRVISYEITPELAALARANLQKQGISNVEVRQGDGSQGSPSDGPFDAILLSGSVAQVPQNLLAQLKVGGRLVAIVGDEPVMMATIVTRTSTDSYTTTSAWETIVQRLQNFAEPTRFEF
jgi:protein-L-isoaspartate(D-aspartate) O-methyltransferase